MKYILIFSLFVVSLELFAQTPCNGAAGSVRTNPDSSPGCFVANTALY